MSKDLSPKAKKYRRLMIKPEANSDGSISSLTKAVTKRSYPPGVHGPKGHPRLTDFGLHLREKQKICLIYGIMERQLKKYFKQAMRHKGNTGLKLMEFLERRLDNVIYRLGLAQSRRQARQLINHHLFLLNGKKHNIPSYLVKSGDVIEIRKEKSLQKGPIADGLKIISKRELPDWLIWDEKQKKVQVTALPAEKDLEQGIDTRLVVEYYSR